MASEKAAAEFQLETELKRLQEAQVEAERNKVSRRVSTSWEDDTEMKALEYMLIFWASEVPHYSILYMILITWSYGVFSGFVIYSVLFILWIAYGWGKRTVAKGSKAFRFWSCEGHKISMAVSNSLSYAAFLSGICASLLEYLLHRLQEQADTYSSREVAESMGLGNQTLP